MAQITETFDHFLRRVARRLVVRLVLEQAHGLPTATQASKHGELLARIEMADRMRRALDDHIHDLIVFGDDRVESEVLGVPSDRPTWKEIGDALSVTAQAANRKYGDAVRQRAQPGDHG